MHWLADNTDGLRENTLLRFDPRFWVVNFPRPMVAAATNQGVEQLTVDLVFYNKEDLAGLIWESADNYDHPLFRYEIRRDYSGVRLSFRWQSSNVKPLDQVNGPTLTIEGRDAAGNPKTWYVRLWNYATGMPTDAAVTLDFDNLDGGFLLPDEADPVYPGDIDRLFISLVPDQYDGSATGPLTDGDGDPIRIDGQVVLSDMVADGDVALAAGGGYVRPHDLRIANGYDDSFNLTPARWLYNAIRLGYRGFINHYVGMSHYYTVAWDVDEGRYVIDPAMPLNAASEAWHGDFLARALNFGFDVIFSVSFEILDANIPADWRQRAHDGSPALTGWLPPSSLVSPTHTAAIPYIQDVCLAFAGLQAAAGVPVKIQIGEPWWWMDPETDVPFVYDDTTTSLYTAETGDPVPAKHTSIFETPDADQQAYLDWLADKLGSATLAVRDAVKGTHAGAAVTALIYTPQILIPGASIPETVNLPAGWAKPAFDFLQVEDYDNVIQSDWTKHAADLAEIETRLGYAPADTQYFAGFVLNDADTHLWRPIDRAVQKAKAGDYAAVVVWAYTQVTRDGFVYFDLTEEAEVSGFHEVRFPTGIAYGATGGPGFSTQVVAAASGFEQRNANWAQARARYNVGTGVTTETGLHELITFFRTRMGRAYGFRFKDWSDFTSGPPDAPVSPTDQTIGTGDGMTAAFQLTKTYDSGGIGHVRDITKPVAGTVRVAVNGAEVVSGWSVDTTTGVVTFDTAPAAGDTLQAGFAFDVPVRFDTDDLKVALETFQAGMAPDVPVIEIRPA